MRKIAQRVAWLAALSWLVSFLAFASPQERFGHERPGKVPIPFTIGRDLWVSARVLTARYGTLLLAEHPRLQRWYGSMLANALENPPADCLELGPSSYDDARLPDSLSEVVGFADAIISGVVTGIDGGFYRAGHAGLLIQVEATEWMQRDPEYPEVPYVHFYYPVGDFTLGQSQIRICKHDPDWPDPPQIGDQVILFPQGRPSNESMVRIGMDGVEVITVGLDGPRMARGLRRIPELAEASEIGELTRRVAREIARQRRIR